MPRHRLQRSQVSIHRGTLLPLGSDPAMAPSWLGLERLEGDTQCSCPGPARAEAVTFGQGGGAAVDVRAARGSHEEVEVGPR